jgi:gamma-glutamylaminecyclotransferase
VSPAPDNVRHRVFVFGTLKEGFPNFATNRGTRVPGRFKTRQPLPLYLVGDRHVPWLLDAPGQGLQVGGQVFEVDADTLAAMDRLERITEPDGYRRVWIEVVDDTPGALPPDLVHAYLKPPQHLQADLPRLGPLDEYTLAHAALYRPRPV